MAKTIFEEMGGAYVRQGDYFIPDLKLPEKETKFIGIWGQRHKRYLKKHKRATYTTLLTSGKLNNYLADIDKQAEKMFSRMVEQMAKKEGVTEQLKADNQLKWVQKMNCIRNSAMEIVNTDLIYTELTTAAGKSISPRRYPLLFVCPKSKIHLRYRFK